MGDEDFALGEAEELLRRERWPIVQKQLPGICDELANLCTGSYTYSLRYVVQRFNSSQAVAGIHGALYSSDNWATTIGKFFRVSEGFNPNAEQLRVFFEMILGIVSDLQRHAIEPFVRLVREAGCAEAPVLDGYVDFRRRWDDLVKRVEALNGQVGLDLRVSMYLAPELHVPLKS